MPRHILAAAPLAAPADVPLADAKGRSVSYLRLSVTDRCNLRCLYCDGQMSHRLTHEQVLRYEEMLELIGLSAGLGIRKVRLLTNNPKKIAALEDAGIEVHREAHQQASNPHNLRYLKTKAKKSGHLLNFREEEL